MSDFRHTSEGDLLNFLMENVNVFEEKKDADKVPQTMQQQDEPVVDLEQQSLHPHEDEEKRIAKKDRPDAIRDVKDEEVSNEGIVPDTSKDSEEAVIKKLDEDDVKEEMGGGGAVEPPENDINSDPKMSEEEGYADDTPADEELEEALTCCESCGKVSVGKDVVCENCTSINEEPMDSEDDYVEPEEAAAPEPKDVGPSYVAMAQASTDATEQATVGGRSEYANIASDYKDTAGAFEQMRSALPELGLYIIDDPDLVGGDMLGIKISTVPWTAETIQASLRDMDDGEDEVEEGIVPDTSKDSEESVIKKLDEADTNPKDSFLDGYKQLCLKHNMIIVSESESPLQVVDITAYPTGTVPMDQFVVAHIEKHVELLRGTAIEMGDADPGADAELSLDDPMVEEGCMGDEDGPVQEDDSARDKAFARIAKEHPEYSEEEVWKQVHKLTVPAEPVEEELMGDEDAEYDEIAVLDDKGAADDLARKEGGHVIEDKAARKFRVVKSKEVK